MIYGPVHKKWLKKSLGKGAGWRWVSQDLHKYIGHRVHIEFLPETQLEVSQLVFSETEPPSLREISPELRSGIAEASSLREVIARTTRALRASLEGLGGATAGPSSEGSTLLVDWVLAQSDIFEPQPELEARLRERFEAFAAAHTSVEEALPAPVLVLALMDGNGEDEPVHIRGNHRMPSQDRVPRQFLTVVERDSPRVARSDSRTGSGRLDLARALVDGRTPAVPRVMVNRLWHHLFGRGIAPTVDDLGVMGIAPTHPEFLDHLALRFVANDWSVKRMVRALVLSAAYRMSSRPSAAGDRLDPANLLLHRMSIRRLPAESIRDQILTVSGRLDRRLGGPSILVHISKFMRNHRSPKASGPVDGAGRRSVYIGVRRNHMPSFLVAFDRPTPFLTLGKRTISNSPAQPLTLLNDPFVHEQARIWSSRILQQADTPEQRLELAYRLAFVRPPDPDEAAAGLEFIAAQTLIYDEDGESRAWGDFCHVLINVKEFIFVY